MGTLKNAGLENYSICLPRVDKPLIGWVECNG